MRFSGEADDSATARLKEAFLSEGKPVSGVVIRTECTAYNSYSCSMATLYHHIQIVASKIDEFVKELRSGGPMKPGSKEATEAAAAAAATSSGQDSSKVKLSSAKPEVVKAAVKPKPAGSAGRSLSHTETYYARPSDIFECFVVEGKVRVKGSVR